MLQKELIGLIVNITMYLGLELLGDMNTQWKTLHTYFDKMALYVGDHVSNQLEYFIKKITKENGAGAINVTLMSNYAKNSIVDLTVEVNNAGYLINNQAKAYYHYT